MFEVSLADLQGDEDHAYRKIRLRAEDVQGKNVLTNFWVSSEGFHCILTLLYFQNLKHFIDFIVWKLQGMDFTADKLRSLVRKWQSLIEAHVDVKTTDNYTLRLFCIGFTKKRANQQKRTCYAQSSQIRQVNYANKMCFFLPFIFAFMYLFLVILLHICGAMFTYLLT